FPEAERYDGYLQLENGVGMMRLLFEEVEEARAQMNENASADICADLDLPLALHMGIPDGEGAVNFSGSGQPISAGSGGTGEESAYEMPRKISIATGLLAGPWIRELCGMISRQYPHVNCHVYEIRNDYFGEMITVSGLITGTDLKAQLKDQNLGDELLLPCNMLRSGERVFLDDISVEELEEYLRTPVRIVESDGTDFVNAVLGKC
ncbi:MAG: DUF512 domain-containing protein, partial [Lachnospiraceae bacterium]|nr:DUF512 domain-containing protein [Lachnospiraceae bacterium]